MGVLIVLVVTFLLTLWNKTMVYFSMKRISHFAIIFPFFMTSCKVWDPTMVKINNNQLQPRLPALEIKVIDFATQQNLILTHELKTIRDEVESNIFNPIGEKKGIIKISRRHVKIQRGWFYILTSAYTTGLLNIVGFPFAGYKSKVEIEVEIQDLKGNLIKKYCETGESDGRSLVAFYYGYSINNARVKAFSEAISDAFSKIYPKIQLDATQINQALLTP